MRVRRSQYTKRCHDGDLSFEGTKAPSGLLLEILGRGYSTVQISLRSAIWTERSFDNPSCCRRYVIGHKGVKVIVHTERQDRAPRPSADLLLYTRCYPYSNSARGSGTILSSISGALLYLKFTKLPSRLHYSIYSIHSPSEADRPIQKMSGVLQVTTRYRYCAAFPAGYSATSNELR